MAYRNTEGLNYLLTDHLGSVVGVMDASGTLLEEARYTPFGSTREGVGVQGTDLGFTSQRGMPTTGLMDYNARFYDLAGTFHPARYDRAQGRGYPGVEQVFVRGE